MDIETAKRHSAIAFDLMVGLRHDQQSQAYIHAAKTWMALDNEVRKLQRAQKKKGPITSIEPSDTLLPLNLDDQTVTTEIPDNAPAQQEPIEGKAPTPGSKPGRAQK